MRTQRVEIVNMLGLHARAAAKFVTLATQFSCDVAVEKDGRQANGKSIMGVMMLAAAKGTHIIITANGTDEQNAVEALSSLVSNKFGEAQ
ncbi:MAG: HPr family phosphocarrier protein [Gammaproteobacteria bacterium]|nr:HPr family phosphocarrier protein [Gammaproteobacteria bacterium]